jgi:hypothetical protein
MATRQSRLIRLEKGMGALSTLSDQQAAAFVAHEVADEAFVQAFEAHFAGMDVLSNRDKILAATRLRNSIKRGIERQLDAVIEMGRALLDAEGVFTKQEWDHLLEGGQQLLGLPKHTASMYRAIARDIDGGRIPRERCPESFSTVYRLTTFTDSQLKRAREVGLLRPTVTRKEVEEFKRLTAQQEDGADEAEAETASTGKVAGEAAELRAQARQLRKQEGRLQAALARVHTHLEAIRKRLTALSES